LAVTFRVPVADRDHVLRIERSKPHGHFDALLTFIRHIGLEKRIGFTPGKERDLVIAMLVERLIHSSSKLATTRPWNSSTLAEEMGIEGCDENDLYAARTVRSIGRSASVLPR